MNSAFVHSCIIFVVCFLVVVDSYKSLRVPTGTITVYNLPITDLNGGTEDRTHHQQA